MKSLTRFFAVYLLADGVSDALTPMLFNKEQPVSFSIASIGFFILGAIIWEGALERAFQPVRKDDGKN